MQRRAFLGTFFGGLFAGLFRRSKKLPEFGDYSPGDLAKKVHEMQAEMRARDRAYIMALREKISNTAITNIA